MNWEFFAAWFNRFGMILEFVSFWLATPEIIGEERLSILAKKTASYTKTLKDSNLAIGAWLLDPSRHDFFKMSDSYRGDSSCMGIIAATVLLIFVETPILILKLAAIFLIIFGGLGLEKLLERLANNHTLRRSILFLGVFFYIFGFMLQLVATF